MRKAKNADFIVVKEVNTRDRRVNFRINIAALIVIILCGLLAILITKISFFETFSEFPLLKVSVILVSVYIYFVLHELLHALFYMAFSDSKVKISFHSFALSTDCPNGIFRRYEYILIAIIPFVLISILLFFFIDILPNGWIWVPIILQIENTAGAISDFYTIFEVVRGPKRTYVNDDGLSLKFYKRKNK